ncbi:hypothetical protein GCM10018780_26260 [Streptomyces lanatus]|nr:hypothetical protein GCM10018780_26260 [Streptomyces lanatus]
MPERDLPDLDADHITPDDPKEENEYLLRKDIHAETLILTGGTAAFREGFSTSVLAPDDVPLRARAGRAL